LDASIAYFLHYIENIPLISKYPQKNGKYEKNANSKISF